MKLKVFNPTHPVVNVAEDWGISNYTTESVDDQPFRIAAVPVLFDDPESHNYYQPMVGLDLSEFDLVLLSDIEYTNYSKIFQWVGQHRIKSYAVIVGGLFSDAQLDKNLMVYRPWWVQNANNQNQGFEPAELDAKPFLFEALLGARRPHRDYVMFQMQRHPRLLNQSIVNYRDVFTNGNATQFVQQASQRALDYIADLFPKQQLGWPYISPNLDPSWEVADRITHTVSQTIPKTIYEKTWYSILCETLGTGSTFFMSEKFSKAVLARRAFVVFSTPGYLGKLRELGFETFSSVIDEDYDYETRDFKRYQQAWSQVLSLSYQDPIKVYEKLKPVLEHNRRHIDVLWNQTVEARQQMLRQKIPAEYF